MIQRQKDQRHYLSAGKCYCHLLFAMLAGHFDIEKWFRATLQHKNHTTNEKIEFCKFCLGNSNK